MKIYDSVTGQEHLEIYADEKCVHIEPLGNKEWVITDDLKKLIEQHEEVTLKDLFQYFGFLTTLSREDAKKIMEEIKNEIRGEDK